MSNYATNYTIGQVADICNVHQRTASNWFDSGRLRGYRIPGSQERRVPRVHLLTFIRENKMLDVLQDSNWLGEPKTTRLIAARRAARNPDRMLELGFDPIAMGM